MMGRKGIISVLVIIAGLLLSDHGAKGQSTTPAMAAEETTLPVETTLPEKTTTAPPIVPLAFESSTTIPLVFESSTTVGSVISSHSCPSYTQNREAICSLVSGSPDITTFMKAGGDLSNVCSHSMLQYGCASFEDISASTCAAVLECFLADPMAVTSQESYSLMISQIPVATLGATLNILNNKIPSASIPENNKQYLLNSVFERLRETPENLSPGVLATWFQEKLYSYIPSIDTSFLDCVNSLPMPCDSFESMVSAMDVSYSKFEQTKKEQIGSWITDFINTHSCSKGNIGDTIKAYYKSFLQNVEITSLSMSGSITELGSAIEALTDFQLAQYCNIANSFDSDETASPILQYIETQDYTFIFNFLSYLDAKNYGQQISYSLLSYALIKLNASDDPLCRPKLKTLFQAKFSYLFIGINSDILHLISPRDCSDYQDVFRAIDTVYSMFSEDVQGLLYEYRYNYLSAETIKSGSACTYGLTSSQWFQFNLGESYSKFSYPDIMSFNHNFDGFEAFEFLSVSQSMDLIMASEIFTSESPKDAEMHISYVITALKKKGYEYLQSFMIELKVYLIKFNIKFIANISVRKLFLEGVWGILEEKFAVFAANDWHTWYNEYLNFCLSSITSEQLSLLSNTVVEDCSNLGSIVGGFDSVYEYMDKETKSVVTNWIVGFLKNDASKCKESEGNWLITTFKSFSKEVSITIVIELRPDFNLMESLHEFTPTQIGQVVFSEPSALSNETVIEEIFSVLIVENDNKKTVENIGAFWDSFNVQYEEIDIFTVEVKLILLERTFEEVSLQYPTFMAEDFALWWDNRLRFVTTVVTQEIMEQIPLTISCDSYKAIVKGMNNNYEETLEASQNAVYNFMVSYFTKGTKCSDSEVSTLSFLETSMGSYSEKAAYEELLIYYPAFNVFEEGVMAKLSEVQIGDMIVVANVYESQEKAVKVIEYLQTLTIEKVDICFTQFTETAIKKNIKIDNFSVGQYMLQSYLNIIKIKLVTYTHTEIIQLFEFRISLFIKFFSKTILQIFIVEDCDTLVVIVNQLDKGFPSMTEDTQKDIASWILDHLKSSKLNGCGSLSQITSEWVGMVFKKFFTGISLSEAKEVLPSIDIISIINSTSVSQKVEYIFSSEETLVNVESVKIVLESIGADGEVTTSEIYSFCSEFNVKYETLTVKYMTYEVQEEIFTYFFTYWYKNLNSMTEVEISQFEEYFNYFLPGVTETSMKIISENMGCNVYKAIFSALSSITNKLSEEIQMAISKAMIKYLDAQSTGSSDGCGSLYTDSRTYVINIYFSFFKYVKFYQMIAYYKEFDVYKVLDLCSGQQLGNLFMNSTAINNQLEAGQIFVELQNRASYLEISSFMIECTTVAEEKGIVSLPNANIQELLSTVIWEQVSKNLKTESDFQWFSLYTGLIISSITATSIDTIEVLDCNSQRYLVEGFSKGFEKQDENQKDSVYGKIKEFNKKQKDSAGSACSTESGTSSEWISVYYSKYAGKADYKEFKEYKSNFSAADSLEVLSGTQVAEYVIESGILRKEEEIVIIYESMDTTQKLEDFLVKLNEVAPDELHNSPFVSVIMSESMKVISEELFTFTEVEYIYWFQEIFTKILFSISEADLKRIPYPLSCASSQALITGFDNVYDEMTEETRKNIYTSCIKPQFNSITAENGVRCGQNIQRTQEWVDINMKRFSIYVEYIEFEQWNTNFKNTDIIDTASPKQLGVIAAETITREETACQVAGVVQQFAPDDASSFLVSFSAAIESSNAKITDSIGSKIMSASIAALKSSFAKYSSSDWENLLSIQLKYLMPSMTGEVLTSMLASADCSGYFVIVKYLNVSYDHYATETKPQFAGILTDFLKRQPSGTCPMEGDSSVVASALFGWWISYVAVDELSGFVLGFDWLQAIGLLSASQQGSLAFTGDTLNDESKAAILGDSIQAMSFDQVDQFLASFQDTAEKKSLTAISNVPVRDMLQSALYKVMSPHFSSFNTDQWGTYFQQRMNYFLPSITASQIGLIPNSISCDAFQSFIAGCSNQYSKLSGGAQRAIADKAKSYLSFNKPDFGPKCPPSSGGSGEWLNKNFALFSDYCSIPEILALNPNFIFTDAVPYLTADHLGFLASSPEFLGDRDKMSKIMNGITIVTLGEFLDYFNAGLVANGITQISNVVVRKFLMGEIFCKLGSAFSTFTVSDYSQWFGKKLIYFISSLDAKALGFLPRDMSCDSLAATMVPLNALENPENPDTIFEFTYSVLEAQKASSGVACTSSSESSSEWLLKYIGKMYSPYAIWAQYTSLNPTIVVSEVKSYLTPVQLASATSSVISSSANSADVISMIFSYEGTMDGFFDYMGTMDETFRKNPDLNSNNKVKDAMMMMVANWVFTSFGDFDVATTQAWMNKITFLLPNINSTMLEMIPNGISCEQYQVIVKSCSGVYYNLSPLKRQNIADFIKTFLLHKLATDSDSCATGLSVVEYIQKNFGLFCKETNSEDITSIYSVIEPVSFVQVCDLS